MTTHDLGDATLIQPSSDVVFGDVDGEIVALNMESGSYLHLNSSGTFIFSVLDGSVPRTLEWLCQRVRREYEVDDATCRQEVGDFVARCVGLGLLRVPPGA